MRLIDQRKSMFGLFITGVGTGVGKTLVTTILCRQLQAAGANVVALKPIVSGYHDDDPESDPALLLRSLGIEPTREAIASISPWRFAAPLAPPVAAFREGRSVRLEDVVQFCEKRAAGHRPFRLVEGAGGVMSPICQDGTCIDLIAELGIPAVLVTGTYLGAISHTLTALAALRESDVLINGVVVSESTDSVGVDDTIESIREFDSVELPLFRLPRLEANRGEALDGTPSLLGLCDGEVADV